MVPGTSVRKLTGSGAGPVCEYEAAAPRGAKSQVPCASVPSRCIGVLRYGSAGHFSQSTTTSATTHTVRGRRCQTTHPVSSVRSRRTPSQLCARIAPTPGGRCARTVGTESAICSAVRPSVAHPTRRITPGPRTTRRDVTKRRVDGMSQPGRKWNESRRSFVVGLRAWNRRRPQIGLGV